MGALQPIFRRSTGLNTKIDGTRLPYDPATGIMDLAVAYNVDIDDTGRVSRRSGFAVGVDGISYHSLFCDQGTALVCSGNALMVLHPDLSTTSIRNVTVGARMVYVATYNGADEEIYYCNGYEKGVVRGELSYDWTGNDYVGPTKTKTFDDPPTGHLLGLYNGRMYVAEENMLWYSQPFAYSWFDYARNYIPFKSRLRMIAPADDGLFISTDEELYALTGPNPAEFISRKLKSYPAVEGTMVKIDGSKLGEGDMPSEVPMFATTKGLCVGGPGGTLLNLTERKLSYPAAMFGAGLAYNDKYICTFET